MLTKILELAEEILDFISGLFLDASYSAIDWILYLLIQLATQLFSQG